MDLIYVIIKTEDENGKAVKEGKIGLNGINQIFNSLMNPDKDTITIGSWSKEKKYIKSIYVWKGEQK